MNRIFLFLLLFAFLLSCSKENILSPPEELPASIGLLKLETGKSWTYSHSIYDSLPGSAVYSDTKIWELSEKKVLGGKEYFILTENLAMRESAEGLYVASYDPTDTSRVSTELFFKIPVQDGEGYSFTFQNADTTITYEMQYQFTHVQNGDEYWGSWYSVVNINGVDTNQGPSFLFRAGYYLKAIDRFPFPPYHFWSIIR